MFTAAASSVHLSMVLQPGAVRSCSCDTFPHHAHRIEMVPVYGCCPRSLCSSSPSASEIVHHDMSLSLQHSPSQAAWLFSLLRLSKWHQPVTVPPIQHKVQNCGLTQETVLVASYCIRKLLETCRKPSVHSIMASVTALRERLPIAPIMTPCL